MDATRFLIINADDFGASRGVNQGIIRAHRFGVLTSASLMVRHANAAPAVALSRECPEMSIGLHVDLGEWTLKDGEWVARYEIVPMGDRGAVHAEVERQLAEFQRLMGRPPTHLDSHQHVHLDEPVRLVMDEIAQSLEVPLRRSRSHIQYCGRFYGQDENGVSRPEFVSVDALLRILADLPRGISELCCHPSQEDDLDTMYLAERRLELASLCDPSVRDALTSLGIRLCSFETLPSRDRMGNLNSFRTLDL